MTAGIETAPAHQALATGMEKAAQARRDLLDGLREVKHAAQELGDDWLADDAGKLIPEILIASNELALLRVDVVARLSLRISQHRTHQTGPSAAGASALDRAQDVDEHRLRWVVDALRSIESEFEGRMTFDEISAVSVGADLLDQANEANRTARTGDLGA